MFKKGFASLVRRRPPGMLEPFVPLGGTRMGAISRETAPSRGFFLGDQIQPRRRKRMSWMMMEMTIVPIPAQKVQYGISRTEVR